MEKGDEVMRRRVVLMTFVCLLVCSGSAVHGIGPLRLLETPTAWIREHGSPDSFHFEDGTLTARRGGNEPSALLTKASYENFELTFEFRLSKYCESGLYIAAPLHGRYRAGLEIELSNKVHDPPTVCSAGAIFRRRSPQAIKLAEPEHWNTCSVRLDWPRLTVHLNGLEAHDVHLDKEASLRYALRRGAIGFQNLGGRLEVRRLLLTPLPDREHGKVLTPPEGLDGWEDFHGDARWENRGGVLRGENGDGYLLHETVCKDFDLRLYYRTSPNANGGVFFRWLRGETYEISHRGQEVQIWDAPGTVVGSGSIYHLDRGNDLAYRPCEWNLLQISVRGRSAVTHINGVRSAATDRLAVDRPGQICLQMHRTKAWIEFKEIVLVTADR